MTTATAPRDLLPAEMLRALSAETANLRTARPDLADRIASAFHLATSGAVSQDAAGRWQVESRTTPGVSWQVDGSCDCPDAEHAAPDGLCAHRLAVGITKRALKALARHRTVDLTVSTYGRTREHRLQGVVEKIAAQVLGAAECAPGVHAQVVGSDLAHDLGEVVAQGAQII